MPTKSIKSETVNTDKNNLATITITFVVSQDTTVVSVGSTASLDDKDDQVIKLVANLIHQTIIPKLLTNHKK